MFISPDDCGVIGELSNSSNLDTWSKNPYVVFGQTKPKTSKLRFKNTPILKFQITVLLIAFSDFVATVENATPKKHPMYQMRSSNFFNNTKLNS